MTDDTTMAEQLSITRSLNIRGWSHLDAILLASLATEAPLLLIGPHGTGKSLLVERIARALHMTMRHYNAALINYDDLVGIPMPDETGENLHFITTPGTIWDAEFVFIDEISRCRADLQNKLFPIVHEKRVVGVSLDKLHHRWAAMNPPAPDNPDVNSTVTYYYGSEPLDPALTDRFPFVVPVPNWAEMSKAERYEVVAGKDMTDGNSAQLFNLAEMVQACADLIPTIEEEFSAWLGDYMLYVMDLLDEAQLPQSPRRARMLAQSVIAVHAARIILEGHDADPEYSAELTLTYGMPQTASEVPPAKVKVVALHRQAWQMKEFMADDWWRQVLEEPDMARRVLRADELGFGDEDMSRLVTQTISAEDSNPRQIGLATAMFLYFREKRSLDPSAYEPLAQLAYHVLEPRQTFGSFNANSSELTLWNDIRQWLDAQQGREEDFFFHLERNFVLQGFPNLWRSHDWQKALQDFKQDLALFGISQEN